MHHLVRAAWYAAYEGGRLRRERKRNLDSAAPWGWTTNPLISVYVPTHNRRDLLIERALKSILEQTYENLEIIVAAHGCTDGTERRVKALADPRIRVLSVPRRRTYPPTPENHWFAGPVEPANAALIACRGKWIARNDDDDVWTPDHIESLLRFAQDGEYEFVSAAHKTHEKVVSPYWIDGWDKVGGTQTWLYRSYLKFMRYNPDCWKKKRDRVNDTDLQYRMSMAGVRMGYLDKVVAHVLPRPGETTVGLKAYQNDAAGKMEQYAF